MEGGKALADIRSAVNAVSAEKALELPLHEIENLCMQCQQNLVLMTFECPHCYERNNEVQFAGQLHSRGCNYQLQLSSYDLQMLDRLVVKFDSATIKIDT